MPEEEKLGIRTCLCFFLWQMFWVPGIGSKLQRIRLKLEFC